MSRSLVWQRWRGPFLFAVLALPAALGACAQPDNTNRLTSAVPMVGAQPSTSPDPYHYRCIGNCQAGM
jgi:hypothetical protein